MKVEELTPQHRIEILEDVLRKLESGDTDGGLCLKIRFSAFELLQVWDKAKSVIPIFTFENAIKVTEVMERARKDLFWWNYFDNYDFENRIKFVKWMINEYKLTNNI